MALGDNRFAAAGVDFATLQGWHGVSVTLSRIVQADVSQRDPFGDPVGYTPTTSTITILVSEQYLQEEEIVAGGKPKEMLQFMNDPGLVLENDEISYQGHTYKVQRVTQVPLGGTTAIEVCEAWREVAA